MKELISWSDFEKLDIRTGTIISAADFPKAIKPAYQLTIDFGDFGIKNSSAQITAHYAKEDLIGIQILAIINFPPKQIANFKSECLLLGIYEEDGSVTLAAPLSKIKNGLQLG